MMGLEDMVELILKIGRRLQPLEFLVNLNDCYPLKKNKSACLPLVDVSI